MNAHTAIAGMGHNAPPCPLEAVAAEYSFVLSEAENWADGEPVTDEAGMKAVDTVLKEYKTYRSALKSAGEEITTPLHQAHKDGVAAVKVYTNDADTMQKALVALVAPFKQKLADEKEAAKRAAWDEARRLEREAQAKVDAANAANIDEQREAQAAQQAALDASKAAQATTKDTVKGMRTVKHHEVMDMQGLANWSMKNLKPEMVAVFEEIARKHNEDIPNDIVRSWTVKEAF